MPSNKAKGDAHELEVKDYLEALGWTVFKQHRKVAGMFFVFDKRTGQKKMMPRMKGADIFGCDIIAKKPGELTRWIQVGAEGAKSKKEAQLNEFYWDTDHETTEIWLRVEGKKTYRVWVLKRVDSPDTGPGQSFVDTGFVEVGHTLTEARARLLRAGA